jgi:sterol desaturase/sphingolipid hydroxylase (fatty acid hydroxylase superfamily)
MLTILGLPPAAATLTILAVTFLSIFQHANLRTPRWLGYIVQRPESHTIHHARGVHAKNYADLPLIDMLFGTFENPRSYEHATGFWHGASARVLDMLLWRDVSNASPRA